MRNGELEHIVTTGKLEGKRGRGRLRDELTRWHGKRTEQLIDATQNRVMAVKASRLGT